MVWFKVDDKLHDHRKARAAGKSAMGVWVLAGSWSGDNLTDGFIPESVLSRWGTKADANRLVAVGLWEPAEQDGERGWRFHAWGEFQPTRAEKVAERAARSEAGRKGGKASGRSRREAKAKQLASGGVEPPTRPDPSPAAAAAEDTAAAVAIDILADKLRAYTLLRGIRTDLVKPDQAAQIVALIEKHGDQRLVDQAIASLRRDDPPRTIQAFIGSWEAMPDHGQRLAAVKTWCENPSHDQWPLDASGTCRACVVEGIQRKADA